MSTFATKETNPFSDVADSDWFYREVKDMIHTIVENMNIRRFVIVESTFSTYIHCKGTTGVSIGFDADETAKSNPRFAELCKNTSQRLLVLREKRGP